MTLPCAVATTAAVFTPATGPAGAGRCSTGTRASLVKFTVAYQRPSECRVTVMCCSVAWPRRSSRRSLAWAGHPAAMRTQPYLASRTRPASSASPSRTVNRARSRCRP